MKQKYVVKKELFHIICESIDSISPIVRYDFLQLLHTRKTNVLGTLTANQTHHCDDASLPVLTP